MGFAFVDVFEIDQGFGVFIRVYWSETVKYGGSIEFIQGVDFCVVLDEQFAYLRACIKAFGVIDQVMQGCSLVHVHVVGVAAQFEQGFDFLKVEVAPLLDNLDEGNLIVH